MFDDIMATFMLFRKYKGGRNDICLHDDIRWLRRLPPLLHGVYEMSAVCLIGAHAVLCFSFASFCLSTP